MTRSTKAYAIAVVGLIAAIGGLMARFWIRTTPELVMISAGKHGGVIRPAPSDARRATYAKPPKRVSPAGRADLLARLRARLRQGATTNEICDSLRLITADRPAMAAEIAAGLSDDPAMRYAFTGAVLEVWAQIDCRAAWAWSLDHEMAIALPGAGSLSAIVLDGATTADPAGAVACVSDYLQQNDGSHPGVVLELVDALLGHDQLDLARRTVEAWEQGDLRMCVDNAALERISLRLAAQSPAEASDWLGHLPATPERNQAIATLAAAMVGTDPQAAMNWAASLDPSTGRNDAMQRVFNRWAQSSVTDAAQWLADHEAHPGADRLISNLIETAALAQNDPTLALRWADLIADRDLQTREKTQVVLTWAARDPADAANYVMNSTTLDADQKAKLLKTLRAQPPGPSS